MALPIIIEIIPPAVPPEATVTIPGSKSITNRALILAAMASGETTLTGALWSEDTQVMTECLQELGFMINVRPDPQEPANRTITVYGQGGRPPRGGTEENPLEMNVGNAGTAARFLAAFVCLGQGVFRLSGVPRMHQRPQAALFQALRELGYRVEAMGGNDRLPALIYGAGPRTARCRVSIEQSSQFASALLLVAEPAGWTVQVEGENEDESPYVVMTSRLLAQFPKQGGVFHIEPDASSGSYFIAAAKLWPHHFAMNRGIQVAGWPTSGLQVDEKFPQVVSSEAHEISRSRDLGDSILTAMILAPFGREAVRFTDLGRLRVQECERVQAMRTELSRCGAQVIETGDTLEIWPGPLHGAEIETYQDHRIAMAFAILGLKVPGIRIKNPTCVKKTFPDFFQKLAASPPSGLGVRIRDLEGRLLELESLFAE
jgi:3-phosphoshikimate 1-carboxyvinyltransferase